MRTLLSQRAVDAWAREHSGQKVLLADIGCGKGRFIRDFTQALRNQWNISNMEITGVDLVRSPGNLFSEVSANFNFIQQNLEAQRLPFPDASLDFLCCNHVLEHIFETEQLVREFRRVLRPNALCVISVPNVAAWINRVAFIFGGQPLGSELGTEVVTYGFWPGFMQKKLEPFKPSGHIRDFTPRGLKDLAEHCGFRTVGWWKQSTDTLAQIGKWAGRNIGILVKPAR